jgi:hypothetical protein
MASNSIRLTNYDRDAVIAAALEASFKDRSAALKAAADKLGRRCYEVVFSAPLRKSAAAMPAGWLSLDTCLRFNVAGMDVRLSLLGEGLPVPHRASGYCERLGAITDEDTVAAIRAHQKATEDLKDEQRKARSSLKALLYSVSTLKALRELWPEGEPFFVGLDSKSGAPGLPAPQITELNALLGIQKEAA